MPKLSQYAIEGVVSLHSAEINLKLSYCNSLSYAQNGEMHSLVVNKGNNYNKPRHFKNAKQINVYIQIIKLSMHFDNICFVTAIVVIYFDSDSFPYL